MESIKEIFKIGYGPSSSHTMGPSRAAVHFRERYPDADGFRVTLYGSLALTGRGHGTDIAVKNVLNSCDNVEIIWNGGESLPHHPNGMLFEAFKKRKILDSWEVYSIGGGNLWDDRGSFTPAEVYPSTNMEQILSWCNREGATFVDYVTEYEGMEVLDYLKEVWERMQQAIENGLNNEGPLPGTLKLARKASSYGVKAKEASSFTQAIGMLFAAALAVAEENAGGGVVVTAPTCGSCGVLPAVLYFLKYYHNMSDARIIRGLATAGLIGNIVKSNGSISGAEVGCQGEIGTACSMAAGAAAQIWGGTPNQIEYAAEMAFEHNLGLTCDPIEGYVQIPCIERNAFGAQKARECASYALLSDGCHMVSFDEVVETMMQTGRDMQSKYRETGQGGLARVFVTKPYMSGN